MQINIYISVERSLDTVDAAKISKPQEYFHTVLQNVKFEK